MATLVVSVPAAGAVLRPGVVNGRVHDVHRTIPCTTAHPYPLAYSTRSGSPRTTSSTKAYECILNIPMVAVHLAHVTERLHLSDVASAAPR